MTTPKDTIWEIEPHTQAKHEILRRYLGAWFPILGKYNQRVVYIDGFSGPGRYMGGEPGSPIIALREALKHSTRLSSVNLTFLFMDVRKDRIEHLSNELINFSVPNNFVLRTITGSFDVEFKQMLDDIDANGLQIAPTFAFIDPFGFKGLPFGLVKRLLGNPKTEVFINVMVDSINRFLEHPDAQTTQHIATLFDTPKALDIANSADNRIAALRMLYQEQLKKCAKYVRFFEMRNSQGRTIYYLFFATNHPLGHVKMKEAFWKIDESSGYRFSDATNPYQPVLFEIDDTPTLANDLHNHFINQKVAVAQVKTYVENQTPFIATHMRKALILLENDQRILVDPLKIGGEKRRKGSFPENVSMQFIPTLF